MYSRIGRRRGRQGKGSNPGAGQLCRTPDVYISAWKRDLPELTAVGNTHLGQDQKHFTRRAIGTSTLLDLQNAAIIGIAAKNFDRRVHKITYDNVNCRG